MRLWLMALGGLLVWAAHFFTLYALGSIFETTMPARIGTLVATLIAVAANLWLVGGLRRRRSGEDRLSRWMNGLAAGGVCMSLVATVWQGLFALFA